MSFSPDNKIYYKDLIDNAKNLILDICQNVDSYRDVPEGYKSGFASGSREIVINRHNGKKGYQQSGYNYNISSFTSSTNKVLNIVSSDKVISDFESFMESRGIMAKSNSPVTTKGLLNFYNNLAAFCSVRIIVVSGNPYRDRFPSAIFYNQESVSYPSVDSIEEGEQITAEDVNSALTALTTTMNNINKGYSVRYDLKGWSSSSCSSSSSSSSSSSNCSSIFIAYMKI